MLDPGTRPGLREVSLFVRAAEIGFGVVLALLDDPAPARAGAGERLEQFVALAPADRALQRGQTLGEALEHPEHRLALGEEHLAPHRRVRRRAPGEVAGTDRKSTRPTSSHQSAS